jgi:hypothetical protein
MSVITSNGVSAEIESEIRATQTALRDVLRDSLRTGVRLGQLLYSAKDSCHHGEWDAWLKRHFDGTPRHARRLMLLAREYPDPEQLPVMSLSEALRALSGARKKCKPVLFRVNERLSTLGAKTLLPRVTAIAQTAGEAVAVVVLPAERIRELAERKEDTAPTKGNSYSHDFDVGEWIRAQGLDVTGPDPWAGKPGAPGRYRWVFKTCPWNPEHTDRSAFIVEYADGKIGAGCHHNGCEGKGWHDLRDVVEPGWRDRRHEGNEHSRCPFSAEELAAYGVEAEDTAQPKDHAPGPDQRAPTLPADHLRGTGRRDLSPRVPHRRDPSPIFRNLIFPQRRHCALGHDVPCSGHGDHLVRKSV